MARKVTIPKAVREQCWLEVFGKTFEINVISLGVRILLQYSIFMWDMINRKVKGGTLDIHNIKPICARCNLSMSDNYTIQEWIQLTKPKKNGSVVNLHLKHFSIFFNT